MLAKLFFCLSRFPGLSCLSGRDQTNIAPPSPSFLEMTSLFRGDDVFANLEFPLQLMHKYGNLCRFPIARKTYLVSGASEMEEILKSKAQYFSKDNFLYRRLKILFGKSLLVTDGDYWKQRRKISQPAFQMGMIKQYVAKMINACEDLIQDLAKDSPTNKQNNKRYSKRNGSQKTKSDKKIDMLALMNTTTLKLTCNLFFGGEIEKRNLTRLGKGIYFSNWYLTHTLFVSPWKPTFNNLRFYYTNYRLNKVLLAIIRQRRQKIASAREIEADKTASEDLLQMLCNAKNEQGQALSDREILNEFKTLILTGHETTGTGLSWIWYLLARYPEYRTLLEEELETVLEGRPPTLEDLPKLSMLRAIVCETFRLYPPIWSVFRSNTQATEVGGYAFPANSLFILSFFSLHRNPEHWENPKEFYPLRFLNETQANRHAFAYLPFSSGPKICIANHFAMVETLLMAARLAQKFRFELCSSTPVFPEPCISLRPKGNLWMIAVQR